MHEPRDLFRPLDKDDQLVPHGACNICDGGRLHVPDVVVCQLPAMQFIAMDLSRLPFGLYKRFDAEVDWKNKQTRIMVLKDQYKPYPYF